MFETFVAALARLRVALGWVFGVLVIILANPTARTITVGMSVALVGELIRIWAAGHLNKAREITSSGPYRYVGHPLYLGSSIMGLGLAIACRSVLVAMLIAVYLSTTITAAIKSEEVSAPPLRRAVRPVSQRPRGTAAQPRRAAAAVQHAAGDRESRTSRADRTGDRCLVARVEGDV